MNATGIWGTTRDTSSVRCLVKTCRRRRLLLTVRNCKWPQSQARAYTSWESHHTPAKKVGVVVEWHFLRSLKNKVPHRTLPNVSWHILNMPTAYSLFLSILSSIGLSTTWKGLAYICLMPPATRRSLYGMGVLYSVLTMMTPPLDPSSQHQADATSQIHLHLLFVPQPSTPSLSASTTSLSGGTGRMNNPNKTTNNQIRGLRNIGNPDLKLFPARSVHFARCICHIREWRTIFWIPQVDL